jgi:hypothetical protein
MDLGIKTEIMTVVADSFDIGLTLARFYEHVKGFFGGVKSRNLVHAIRVDNTYLVVKD